jgi:signal transduction histidine kinase
MALLHFFVHRSVRERWLLPAALLALVLCVGAAVWIAMQEPSLGWRVAPDPQGEGVLLYDPTRAVKVADRAQAQHRVLAIRLAPRSAGADVAGGHAAAGFLPDEVLHLDSLIAVEAPSMLSRQADLDRFFDLQRRVWQLLEQARAQEVPVELLLPDGTWLRTNVQDRDWDELGWLFWVPLFCGMLPFVVGVAVSAWRWQSMGARFLGLASVMALLSLSEVSVVTGRLWLLAPWFAESGQIFVRCASLVAVWAFVMMLLHYPTPLRQARAWMRASAAWLAVLLVLNVLQWPDQLAMRYKLWLVVASAALVGLSIAQGLVRRHDPVHRAAARWLAVSALVSFSVVMVAFAVSLVYGVQVVSNSYRWLSVPLLYVGLMFSVGRTNLFELERWWVPLCLWYLGGTLVVLTDLALVALLQVDASAAITVSLLAIGWLYFPVRQWLLARLQVSSRPRMSAYMPDLIGAVNAGLAGEQAARLAWRDLLQRVFEPQAMSLVGWTPADAAGLAEPVGIADMGRQLRVPDVAGCRCWTLTLARGGRQLFTPDHAQVAGQLWQLLDHGLNQQRKTQEAVEQERLRIASDLHDDLGAKLLLLAQHGGAEAQAALAREALADMRQSVHGMASQPARAEDALADWRAETMTRLDAAGLAGAWTVEGLVSSGESPLMLPPRLRLQLGRVLREAVTNVLRHSGARHCSVQWTFAGGWIELRVQDDGRGMPPPSVHPAGSGAIPTGLGLSSMERRARTLGGWHRFEASPLGGVTVVVAAPLDGGQFHDTTGAGVQAADA